MINPPTRPLTEEELAQVLKLLSTRKNNKQNLSPIIPTRSCEPVPMIIKAPAVSDNTSEFFKKDQRTKVPTTSIMEEQVEAEPANTNSTSKHKAFFSKAVIWIIIGSTVCLISVYIYREHYQKRENKKNNNRIKKL